MGGGDLNMKKSWHPLLLKNQERVWLEEKKALEEKKKLDQLRKEKEEERQLQELQRLQEEQTGKKRTEKLEWMYATPATGSSQNPNDLEDYLLGKKRVDKILTADENAKLGATHKNFIAVQNANNARDIAAKIREDPLLAIKQQEQAAYQALMSNPLRLRELQKRNGIKPKKDRKEKKREKEERKQLKHDRKHRRDRDSTSPSPPRRLGSRRSLTPDRSRRSRSPGYRSSPSPRYRRSPSPRPSSSRFDDSRGHHRGDHSPTRSHRRHSPEGPRHRSFSTNHRDDDRGYHMDSRSLSGGSDTRRNDRAGPPYHIGHTKRSRSRSPTFANERYSHHKRSRVDRSPPRSKPFDNMCDAAAMAEERAARLAAMSNNANNMSVDRQKRLAEMLEREKAELEVEEQRRAKSGGVGGFLSQEQKKVFGGVGDLEDRIRRGRGGMVIDAD
ncbi:Pre-mRNA splicing factor-domain-containing protein [Crucibulum laeve]|uniref:Pre-mRNA splicing factor-domain-containing protein n=1 Tax=Crucibulum laeve TaxID=68775 RepID=A0A5C3LV15_9AGAR|nr:Pre-mRNA splicing factor-domain-containing protein [Crucibulum laeve]